MNYRRGFQRIYAVITVAWIGVVAVVSIQGRPTQPNDWIEVPSVPAGFTVTDDSAGRPHTATAHSKTGSTFSTDDLAIALADGKESQVDKMLAASASDHAQAVSQYPRERFRYWADCSGIAFGVPAVGYLFLFLIVPWIYRGFRPAAQT